MWSGRICQEMSAKSTRGLRHEMPTSEGFSMRANEVPATTEYDVHLRQSPEDMAPDVGPGARATTSKKCPSPVQESEFE